MKTNQLNRISVLLSLILFSACSKDELPNQAAIGNFPYEKYELILEDDFEDEYGFDESKYVAVGAQLDPIYATYLYVDPFQAGTKDLSITIYPPPGHPLENNLISILIRSEDPEPWNFDRDYFPRHESTIPYVNEWAMIEYWDDNSSKGYNSRYIFQASNIKLKLTREGDLLYGELRNCKLTTFNGRGLVTIASLKFQLRPSDDALDN